MYYAIYQIKHEIISETDYAFRSFNEKTFDFSHYEKVYCEFKNIKPDTPTTNILEDLFYIFNCKHPKEFTGHSLSVSDIVAIETATETGSKKHYWYCNSFGWKDITDYISVIETVRDVYQEGDIFVNIAGIEMDDEYYFYDETEFEILSSDDFDELPNGKRVIKLNAIY